METHLRFPVFRPLYSPYRIDQSWACTVLPPLERFLRDESGTGAAQPFVCRNPFVDRFGSLADMPFASSGQRPLLSKSGHWFEIGITALKARRELGIH
jgi:hypothetical protein